MRNLIRILCLVLCLSVLPVVGMAEEEKITITITDWNTGLASELQKAACEEYMQLHPNIIIDHQTIPYDEYHTKLNTLIAANECPDIYYVSDQQAIAWGEYGTAADLKALYAADGIDMTEKFLPVAMYGTNDKIYGLAYGVVDMVMYYNKAVYDAAGVEYPSTDALNPITWADWAESLKLLTVDFNGKHPGEEGFNAMGVKTYGTLLPNWEYTLSALLSSNGASFFDNDAVALGTPEAKEVLSAVYKLLEDQVAPTPIAQSALPSVAQMFVDGQLATYIGGSFNYGDIAAEIPDIGVAPLPMFKEPKTVGWAACSEISAKTEHMDEVFAFFRWYHEADTNKCHLKTNLPNEYRYYQDEDLIATWLTAENFNDDYRTVIPVQMANYAVTPEMDIVKNASQIFEEYVKSTLDMLWLGEKNVDEVVEILEADLSDIYEGKW